MAAEALFSKIKSLAIPSFLLNTWHKAEKKKRMKKFYAQFIDSRDLCFDVGANFGHWSAAFLSLGARVIAVEPESYCFNLLRQRFRNIPEITIIQKGLGSKEEIKDLKICSNHISSSLSDEFIEQFKYHKELSWEASEKVQVTTLDKLIDEFGLPHFCKIDAEGSELEILKGLSHAVKLIQFEYTPPFKQHSIACIDLLSKLGDPQFNYSSYEHMRLELKDWITGDEMKEAIMNFPDSFLVGDIIVNFINEQ